MKPVPWRIATFLLLLLILGERAFGRLVNADLWGEDGASFLNQAVTLGWASLLEPVAGTYLTLERPSCLAHCVSCHFRGSRPQ